MRETKRKRRHVPDAAITLLYPFFRYSVQRSAYVLRAVGGRRGPVLTAGQDRRSATRLPPRPGR
jgi:hypothetical protein